MTADVQNPTVLTGNISRPWVFALVYTMLLAKVVILFVLAMNTRFVMDEFWQFGQSKYLFDGFYETIWPAKTLGYAVFYKLSHWIGWDAGSMLLAGRVQTAILACGTLFLVYRIALAIGEDRIRALLIVLLLLCFSTFMERIFRTRSEPLALFLATAALYLVVCVRDRTAWSVLGAGILSGCAFLSTQKAVYFNLALGLAICGNAVIRYGLVTSVKSGLTLVAGWILPVAVYCLVFGGTEFVAIAKSIAFGPVEVATNGQTYYTGLRGYIAQTVQRNLVLYVSSVFGLVLAYRRFTIMTDGRQIALLFSTVMMLLIFGHNQPWPYVFIMVLPFIGLWIFETFDHLTTPVARKVFIAAVIVVVIASFWRNIDYLRHNNTVALAVVRQAETMLAPTETYFDGIGLLPNRRESSRRWLDARRVFLTNTDGSSSELMDALQANPPNLIIKTYRTAAIEPVLKAFIENRYFAVTGNIMLPGRVLPPGRAVTFDVPVETRYNLYGTDGKTADTQAIVDGFPRRFPTVLSEGPLSIALEDGTSSLFILPDGRTMPPLPARAEPVSLFDGIYTD